MLITTVMLFMKVVITDNCNACFHYCCTLGHAKLIDKFLSHKDASNCDTVMQDKIKFYDESTNDPDWMVWQCYLLIIAAATETKSGINNLWKSGPTSGHHNYADFGQYIPVNYFKVFCAAALYCWAEEQYWYQQSHYVTWEVFLPCLSSYNN